MFIHDWRNRMRTDYGKLKVIGRAPNRGTNGYLICQCECGKVKVIQAANLCSGRTSSCGCGHKKTQFKKKPAPVENDKAA
jgi:hypothetical protein